MAQLSPTWTIKIGSIVFRPKFFDPIRDMVHPVLLPVGENLTVTTHKILNGSGSCCVGLARPMVHLYAGIPLENMVPMNS